jgi:curved DNA-binding protein CbpA
MAVRKPTHYEILLVDPSVDDQALTAAYLGLARRARLADLDEGRRTQVRRALQRAYAVLHDPERRRQYDRELAGVQDGRVVTVPTAAPPATGSPRAVATAQPASGRSAASRVLDFGRYAGWSLRQIALRDPDYLEWLRRTSIGRQVQADIAAILGAR